MTWDNLMMFVTLFNGAICFLGVLSAKFNDNIFQRIGLALICMVSWSRSYSLYLNPVDISLPQLWGHIGIFFFAFGTWYKVTIRAWLRAHPQHWDWFHFPPNRRKNDRKVQ